MTRADPRPSYERWHAGLGADTEASAPWHLLVRRHLDLARDVAGRRVLEIGCGRGGMAVWLATRPQPPAMLVAADFSSTAVRKAREGIAASGACRVSWEIADVQAIGHAEAAFDTIVSCETIEHVPDPRRALRELARVLRPGGRLFLTTPNYLGTVGLYRAYLRLRGRRYDEGGQPINNLVLLPRTLRWVRGAGLHIAGVDAEGHYLPYPRRQPIRLAWLDRLRPLSKWTALHSIVVARRPA